MFTKHRIIDFHRGSLNQQYIASYIKYFQPNDSTTIKQNTDIFKTNTEIASKVKNYLEAGTKKYN